MRCGMSWKGYGTKRAKRGCIKKKSNKKGNGGFSPTNTEGGKGILGEEGWDIRGGEGILEGIKGTEEYKKGIKQRGSH